jgi:hypothetical protein
VLTIRQRVVSVTVVAEPVVIHGIADHLQRDPVAVVHGPVEDGVSECRLPDVGMPAADHPLADA